jgi:hypothetical protein
VNRPKNAGEQRARKLVAERSGGMCEKCGCSPAHGWHHRKNRSQGGPWCPSNGLHLCGDGTRLCHGWVTHYPLKAHDEGGWVVWSFEDPAEVPVLHAIHGWVRLTDDGGFQPAEPIAA